MLLVGYQTSSKRLVFSVSAQFILVFSLVMYEPPGIEEWHYSYPGWAHALGVLIAVFPLTFLPVIGALQVARQKGRWRRVSRGVGGGAGRALGSETWSASEQSFCSLKTFVEEMLTRWPGF